MFVLVYYPTTRVLAVLALLQSHRRMRGADLAERLEVDIRTLRRYITILQDLGVPIVAERGRYGAYTLASDSYMPPLFLTNDEVTALTVGLLAAKQLGVSEMIPAVESIRAKLEQTMPVALKERIQEMSEAITLDMRSVSTAALNQVLQTMSTAVQQQQCVHLRYRSRERSETVRTFAPYGIVFYQGHWYAVGHCQLRDDLRSFRLDRVQTIALTSQSFAKPAHFDPLSYVTIANATLPRRFSYKVALCCTETELQQENIDYLGVIYSEGDKFILQGTTDDLDWAARELALLSCRFQVFSPEELKTAVRQRAKSLLLATETST
ncbi:MAG: YafY family protein [Chloroflexota bacterium]